MVGFLRQFWHFVHRDRSQARVSQGRIPPPAVGGGGKMILIVDVDGRMGPLLVRPLEDMGFQVLIAQRDTGALELLGQAVPAVVIVGGPASPNFYRALRRVGSVPILALDPLADDEQVLAAFAAGVDQFQAGPIGGSEVVARVMALLRRAA
jgi:DNA-binding response OmpR family regulator